MLKVCQYDGKEIEIECVEGMWKATVEGVSFISQTFYGLVTAISSLHSVHLVNPNIPEISQTDIYLQIMSSKTATILDKQNAQSQLIHLASWGDRKAIKVLILLRRKPISEEAKYITRLTGKDNFSDVTPVEISEYVTDPVQKEKILQELSRRFEC